MSETKIKLVISDFHLSRGKWLKNGRRNPLEDFHQDEQFRQFLEYYSSGIYSTADVELIINGDFFDPLAVIPLPDPSGKFPRLEYPLEVEEPAAVNKMKSILEGHPVSVAALKQFIQRGKKIVFRWGNHDAVILWPQVQELLRQQLGNGVTEVHDQIEFQQKPYIFDRICVDHGHQYEIINQFDENSVFIERKTKYGIKKIQNLPFGSFFVLGFLNRIKLKRSYITQIQPLRLYVRLSMVIEPLAFLWDSLFLAWFFIKMRFITHPMRFARLKKTLMILLEGIHRPSLEDVAEKIFQSQSTQDSPFDTLIMGHNHQAAVRVFPGGKQYLNTGTWIPITSLDFSTLGHRLLRTYALIEYQDGKARASLKIWNGAPHLTDDFN
jgi:UDP-2,3-diacylglucosamine pyrophosphatase LpxH